MSGANQESKKEKPLAVFGILADVQYANTEDGISHGVPRYYRNSLELVGNAVQAWKAYEEEDEDNEMKFVLQLGDLLDGKTAKIEEPLVALDRVLACFQHMQSKLLHIWGNHEFYNFERNVLINTPLNSASVYNPNNEHKKANYYTYPVTNKLVLICLDFYVYSVLGHPVEDENYKEAMSFLQDHNKNDNLNDGTGLSKEHSNKVAWNGGLDKEQLDWLKNQLSLCQSLNKKAIVCGHMPIESRASSHRNLPFNVAQVQSVLHSFPGVCVAYLAGHCHPGGEFKDEHGILHITVPGIVEVKPGSNSYATAQVFEDRILIKLVSVTCRFNADSVVDRVVDFEINF